MTLKQKIETILFIAGKPITVKKLVELTKRSDDEVKAAVDALIADYDGGERGIQIMRQGTKLQMATHPDAAKLVEEYVKAEQFGELTKPSLETLTIIAYRGPITKPELEAIRGVNCSLILRNLLIKGLIEAEDNPDCLATVYAVTFDFLRYLGIKTPADLPDYDKLRNDPSLEKLLNINLDDTEELQESAEPHESNEPPKENKDEEEMTDDESEEDDEDEDEEED